MESFVQDLKFGLRALRQRLGLTAVSVVSLGAGIGAMTTIFTWLNGFALNPLPALRDWSRVVAIHTRAPEGGTWDVSWADMKDWRAASRTVDVMGWDIFSLGLRDGGGATERAWGVAASGNYFEVLGVGASLGRVLTPADESRREPVVVLGHGYWQRRFAGDSSVIGRTITLNGSAFTVVGVAAERFRGTYIGMTFNLYVPMTTLPLLLEDGARLLEDRTLRSMYAIGRLKPGVTLAQAAAEVDPLARRAGEAGGLAKPLGAVVRFHKDIDAPATMRPLLGAMLALAGLVLLIACANVANLLLARAVARRREVAVRLAVGASRVRLVRQLLTESLVLAALAGGVGVFVASWGRDAIMQLLPAVPYPVGIEFYVDGRVLVFAVTVTALTALAFGLVPALQASRPDLVPALKDEIGEGAGGRGRLQGALVAAQVALSLVTLVAAGLFLRSVGAARSVDTGMSGLDRVLLVNTNLQLTGVTNDSQNVALVRALLERTRALPGVEAAAVAQMVVLGPGPLGKLPTQVEGYVPRASETMNVSSAIVSGGYFAAIGSRQVEGRDFTDADLATNAPVVVVNDAFAKRYLGGRPALGARVSFDGAEWLTVVGVVATTKVNSYTEAPEPVIFRPYSARFAPGGFIVYARGARDAMAMTGSLRQAFTAVSAELPFLDPRSMADFTSIAYWPQKVGATLLAAVGGLALLLASIGIYATMAYAVSRRVREIGVRLALGASGRDVVRLVLGRTVRITVIGLAIGLVFALLVGQGLKGMLFGVSPVDPITFVGVSAALGGIALLASALPARRAAKVDPMIALRAD